MKKPTSVVFLTNFNGLVAVKSRWSRTAFQESFPAEFQANIAAARLKTAVVNNFFAQNCPTGEILSQKPVEFFGTVVG